MELLANKKYNEAYNLVLNNDYNNWTPEEIQSIINGYGIHYEGKEIKYEVTSPKTAIGNGNYFDILFFDFYETLNSAEEKKIIGEVWYNLPLNNEWSDLTVTFQLIIIDNHIYLELDDIHIH